MKSFCNSDSEENLFVMCLRIILRIFSTLVIIGFCVFFLHNMIERNSKLINQFRDDLSDFSLDNEFKILLEELKLKNRKIMDGRDLDNEKLNIFKMSLNLMGKNLERIEFNNIREDDSSNNFNDESRNNLKMKSEFEILLKNVDSESESESDIDILNLAKNFADSDLEFYDI